MNLNDRLALALSQAVVERLRADPDVVIAHARKRLEFLETVHPGNQYIGGWRRLLDQPLDRIIEVMLGLDDQAFVLRSTAPFTDVLSQEERAAIIEQLDDEQ